MVQHNEPSEVASTLELDALRLALGGLLTLHCVRQLLTVPPLIRHNSLFDALLIEQIGGAGLPWGRVFAPLSPVGHCAWFAGTIVLSLLITIGWHARLSAALLFAMAVETYWGMYPATTVDDQIVNLMLLWLVLLPTGQTLQLYRVRTGERARRTWLSWQSQRIPVAAKGVFALQLILVELMLTLVPSHRVVHEPVFSAGSLFAIAGLIAPCKAIRFAALILAVALHALLYTRTGQLFTSCALLVACCWFGLPRRNTPPSSGTLRPRVGAGTMAGAGLVLAFAVCLVSSSMGWPTPWNAARRVLSDLGLAPSAAKIIGTRGVRSARVESESDAIGHKLVDTVDIGSERSRVLLELLVSGDFAPLSDLRSRIAQAYAEGFCERFPSHAGAAQLLADNLQGKTIHIAWVSCTARLEKKPAVVLLDLSVDNTRNRPR